MNKIWIGNGQLVFYNVFKRIEHMSPSEYRFQKWNGEQL